MVGFKTSQWVAWIGALLFAVISMVSYAFTTFETKESSRDDRSSIEKRLDRIEIKIDSILEKK